MLIYRSNRNNELLNFLQYPLFCRVIFTFFTSKLEYLLFFGHKLKTDAEDLNHCDRLRKPFPFE